MMRKSLTPAIVLLCVAALTLTGCASKKYVNEKVASADEMTATKIGEVQTSVEGNQKAISDLQAKDKQLEDQIAKLSETAKDALARATEAGKLAEGTFVDEIVLTDDNVTFGFDKSSLSDGAKATLDSFVKGLKSKNKNVFIEIQGHTDNIGSEQYNLKLGYKRAEHVMKYLNKDLGVPLHRMNVTSYGEYKPIADNSSKEGRAQNRRVSLVVMK
jgi:outer membrane protein OmpA-like peptidoglycan-associated protein